jgi:hypothetical protein
MASEAKGSESVAHLELARTDAVLPVEIVSLSQAPGSPQGSFRTTTGQTVDLAPGEYLVQVLLPASDPSGVASRAVHVSLQSHEDEKIDLQDLITETRALIDQIRQVALAVQDAAPKIARHVQDIADSALAGFELGVNEEARASGTQISPLEVSKGAPRHPRSFEVARLFARTVFRGVTSFVTKLAAILPGTATTGPSSGTATTSVDGSRPPQDTAAKPGGAAADTFSGDPSRADGASGESVSATADIELVTADPFEFVPVERSRIFQAPASGTHIGQIRRGEECNAHIDKAGQSVFMRGAVQVVAPIPIDPLGGTRVVISLHADDPTGNISTPILRPRIDLHFSDPSLNELWRFMLADSFDVLVDYARSLSRMTDNPLRTLLCAYVLFRANCLEDVARCNDALTEHEVAFPDIRIIRAEMQARQGKHADALKTLLGLENRRSPFFRPSVGYIVQRIRLYRSLGDEQTKYLRLGSSIATDLTTLEASFGSLSSAMDTSHLNLVLLR